MLKTVLLLLLAYIAYRFIFGFVIPVARATRNVRRQFKAAQEQMEAQQNYAQNSQQAKSPVREETTVKKSDYIDFEEIK